MLIVVVVVVVVVAVAVVDFVANQFFEKGKT